jgi:Domain of unknown function (DUF4190)/Domain of unknown function (DUF1707)
VPELRASDDDREGAVERLRDAALEGRLDSDELEDRLAQAYAARWCSELELLTADVTMPPAPPEFVQPARRVNELAIASLVVSILWLGFLGSIAAIVLGHIALGQIARSRGAQTGRPVALVGIAFGWFGIAALVLILGLAAGT